MKLVTVEWNNGTAQWRTHRGKSRGWGRPYQVFLVVNLSQQAGFVFKLLQTNTICLEFVSIINQKVLNLKQRLKVAHILEEVYLHLQYLEEKF